jgi:hypothetical protein
VVTNAAHLTTLTTYASTYAVPILAIVGRALLSPEYRANCVEWPLPPDSDKPSSCFTADHMRRMGTPGCIAADLRLLNAGSAPAVAHALQQIPAPRGLPQTADGPRITATSTRPRALWPVFSALVVRL